MHDAPTFESQVQSLAQLFSADELLAMVAEKMGVAVETLAVDMDLFTAGLDSITLMGLVAHWRGQGYPVDFACLARQPRIMAWMDYFSSLPLSKSQPSDLSSGLTAAKTTNQDTGPFPLAPMQYAYWLGRDPNQPLGNVAAHLYTEFHRSAHASQQEPQLEIERLSKALGLLMERHASLRLQVTVEGQQTYLPPGQGARLQVNDWRNKTQIEVEQLLAERRNTMSAQMLNIEAGEVLAIELSLLPDRSTVLHLDVDMISADAISYRVLLRELALLYEDPNVALSELPVSYRECRLASEKRWPEIKKQAGSWWEKRLPDLPDGPQLPLKTPTGQPPHTTRRHFHLASEQRDRLYAQCRAQGLTPAAVLGTLLAETLAGWSKEPRFLLNVPLFLRPMDGPDVSGVVGDFSSSILLDLDMQLSMSFIERVKQTQMRMHEDAAYADYGGVQVLRDLGRMKGRQVTAPVVFTSALNLGELFDAAVRRVFGDPAWIISQGPQVLLDAQVTELDAGLLINWDCREDAFIDGVLDAMFEFFNRAVQDLAEDNSPVWLTCLADRLPPGRVRSDAVSTAAEELPAVAPKTTMEKAVAALWTEVIGGEGDNINQNLFAAGGDSVLASNLVAQVREVFGVNAIDMRRLFNAPTIAGLAEAICASGDTKQMQQIAGIYCELLALNDDELLAEFDAVAES